MKSIKGVTDVREPIKYCPSCEGNRPHTWVVIGTGYLHKTTVAWECLTCKNVWMEIL